MTARQAPRQVWKAAARPDYNGLLLLDTHIWVWMLEGDLARMSHALIALLRNAAAGARLLVSDISYWEVAVKAAKGKLVLSMDAGAWLRRAERAPGITSLAIDREMLLLSARLPGDLHRDPADRILIAAAQLHAAPLVTADEGIIDWALTRRGIPVCDARL